MSEKVWMFLTIYKKLTTMLRDWGSICISPTWLLLFIVIFGFTDFRYSIRTKSSNLEEKSQGKISSSTWSLKMRKHSHYESNYILRLSSNGRSCLKVLLLKRNAFRMKRKSIFARTKENHGHINSRNMKIIFLIQEISFYVQKKGTLAEIRQDSGDNSPCISCQVRKIMCLF